MKLGFEVCPIDGSSLLCAVVQIASYIADIILLLTNRSLLL